MADGRQVAIVTGAGSGIGRASSLALAGEGFAVVLAGRRRELLEESALEIAGSGGEALAVACDVGDEPAVAGLFAAATATFGRVDVVFNNAGIGTTRTGLEDLSLADWGAVVATNLTGTFLCCREAFRTMRSQVPAGGRIINNGSISAHAPRPGAAAYTATKHAVSGLTRQCALEGRRYGIACGQIDIGNAATPLTSGMATAGREQPDGVLRPEPTMDVADVARAVVYMATLRPGANVLFMTVMATAMPYVGRG